MIRTIGLAIAFSPTAEMMLAEALSLSRKFKARLVLIHVGDHGEKEDQVMHSLISSQNVDPVQTEIRWAKGDRVKSILKACKQEHVDLLLAGALKKENLIQYYIGTIARQIMRKAPCSVLILTQPSFQPHGFKNIVLEAADEHYLNRFVDLAVRLGQSDVNHPTWLHVIREVKLYGLAMSSTDQASEDDYERTRHELLREEINKVEHQLRFLPRSNIKVNIKVLSGKSGFELVQFARRKNADLLIVGAPGRRSGILDRIFTHDLEYVFADLPCNLFIVHPENTDHHA